MTGGDGGIGASLLTAATAGSTAGAGIFLDDEALTIGTGTLTISDAIDGTGGVTKSGTGTAILSAVNAYTGATFVGVGRLEVTGSLTSTSFVRVSSGATLGGTGRITTTTGGVTVDAGGTLGGTLVITPTTDVTVSGTIAPGNSIGTLTIVGTYIQGSGSTYAVELVGAAAPVAGVDNDLIAVTGTADIDSAGTLPLPVVTVTGLGGTYVAGSTYTILTATTVVTGTGGYNSTVTTSGVPPAISFTISYTATTVLLTTTASLGSVAGLTPNQLSTANYISTILNSGAASGDLLTVLTAVLNQSTTASLAGALDHIQPEVYDAFHEIGVQNMYTVSGHLMGRFDEIRGGRRFGMDLASLMSVPEFVGEQEQWNDLWASNYMPVESNELEAGVPTQYDLLRRVQEGAQWGGFLRGVGSWNDEDSEADSVGFDARSYGAVLGVDYRLSTNWVMGLALAYMNTDGDFDRGRGETDVDSLYAGPYVSYQSEGWSFDASFIYGHHWYDTDRQVVIPGLPTTTANSKHEADAYSVYLGGAKMFELDEAWRIGPVASVQWAHIDQEAFTEEDAFGVNLRVSERDNDSVRSTLGVRVARICRTAEGSVIPSLEVRWGHEFADDDRDITARFVGIPGTFTVKSDKPERDRLILTAAVLGNLPGGWTMMGRYSYEGDLDEVDAHTVTAGLGWEF